MFELTTVLASPVTASEKTILVLIESQNHIMYSSDLLGAMQPVNIIHLYTPNRTAFSASSGLETGWSCKS